jgi:hypothetical protein
VGLSASLPVGVSVAAQIVPGHACLPPSPSLHCDSQPIRNILPPALQQLQSGALSPPLLYFIAV